MSKKIVILTGVSGVGKTTILNVLKTKYNFKTTVSYTTRQKRPGEINGEHYNFITNNDFVKKIKNGFFLEHDEIFNNHYGTSKEEVKNLLKSYNMIFALSLDGYKAFKKIFDTQSIGLYLLPPSELELKKRMLSRNSSHEDLNNRLNKVYVQSKAESKYFDYIIKPNTMENTLNEILKILNKTINSC